MTPGKLNQKWIKRLENTDDKSVAHKLICEFMCDLEELWIEETESERENRELIHKVVEDIRKSGKTINLI